MKKTSPVELLDKVLLYIAESKTHVIPHSFRVINLDIKEANEILFKLLDDNYVRQDEIILNEQPLFAYTVTFIGRLFIEQGGYKKQKKDNELKDLLASQNQIRIIRNEKLLLKGTWAAAIVGFLVLAWYIFTYFFPNSSPCNINN